MNKEADKNLDALVEKMLKEVPKEATSFNFTTQVMSQVEALSDAKTIAYKPLISNRIWVVLAMIVGCVFSYLIFGGLKTDDSWFSSLNVDVIPNVGLLDKLPEFTVSQALLYGIVGFTFFMGVQILLLKAHFDKRYAF